MAQKPVTDREPIIQVPVTIHNLRVMGDRKIIIMIK